MNKTAPRTLKIPPATADLLDRLSDLHGIKPVHVLSVLVREECRRHGILHRPPHAPSKSAQAPDSTPPRQTKQPRRRGQVIMRAPNKWLLRIYVGRDRQGKRRYVSRIIKGDREQAEKALRLALETRDAKVAQRRSKLWEEIWGD